MPMVLPRNLSIVNLHLISSQVWDRSVQRSFREYLLIDRSLKTIKLFPKPATHIYYRSCRAPVSAVHDGRIKSETDTGLALEINDEPEPTTI